MKKFSLILCLLLVIGLLAACGEDKPPVTDPTSNVTDPTNAPTDKPTDAPTTPANPIYKVTVVDQNGNPVAGVLVQFCDDTSCKMPVKTGADGTVSVSNYPESNYHLTITKPGAAAPEETQYYFESGSTEITITLTIE